MNGWPRQDIPPPPQYDVCAVDALRGLSIRLAFFYAGSQLQELIYVVLFL
jgi:hypothetical protein